MKSETHCIFFSFYGIINKTKSQLNLFFFPKALVTLFIYSLFVTSMLFLGHLGDLYLAIDSLIIFFANITSCNLGYSKRFPYDIRENRRLFRKEERNQIRNRENNQGRGRKKLRKKEGSRELLN